MPTESTVQTRNQVDTDTIGSSMENDGSAEVQNCTCEGYSPVEKLLVDVVYVDDDPLFCQIIGRELGKTSLQYYCFEDITDAMWFLQTHQTRTLISDYRMPKMSGIQFLRETSHLTIETNVFIASASRLPQHIENEATSLGAGFVLKDKFIQSGYIEHLCTNSI